MISDAELKEQMMQGSPCRGLCTTTFDAVCSGCGRTVDEVADWAILDYDERAAIWERLLCSQQ